MNTASLNAIALTVFGVTLSVLLGPLLHLSPAVPASVTALGLALWVADRFWLAGRGGDLVQGLVAQTAAGHQERVLVHEAGHFLAAHLLGVPIVEYTLSPWETFRRGQTGAGGVVFDRSELEQQLASGSLAASLLERYCTIWMAGIAAEQQLFGVAEGGFDDRQQVRLALSQLRRKHDKQLNLELHERWAALRARTLLQENQPAYAALLAQMRCRASVADCCAAIQQQLEPTAPDR